MKYSQNEPAELKKTKLMLKFLVMHRKERKWGLGKASLFLQHRRESKFKEKKKTHFWIIDEVVREP